MPVDLCATLDRAVVPFTIACGDCFFCNKHLYLLRYESNSNAKQDGCIKVVMTP